ncbi:MAG TPA: STAS domain-containing protein [Blastocatellia bacterium]|nr:STAS domain-containing protein [Blastocatellia bacterium]
MTIRIEKTSEGDKTTLRLSGELVSSHHQALSEEIEASKNTITLDLEEVTLVDLEIVRLLARCEARGTKLLHCPPYIREWILRERSRIPSSDEE